jgi:hypothetical protein
MLPPKRPVPPSKIKAPKKLEMVANRVVGVAAPSKPAPANPNNDPSQVRPGHHRYL